MENEFDTILCKTYNYIAFYRYIKNWEDKYCMEIVYIIFAGFLILMGKLFYDQKEQKRKLRLKLRTQFGKVPEWEYTAEKFASIQKYYQSIKEEKRDVDDITWNDVDMDDIFMLMNNTCTSIGEEYLYASLRKMRYDSEQLIELDCLADYFLTHEEERVNLQEKLCKIGRTKRISVYEYLNAMDQSEGESILIHVLQALALVAGICLIPFQPNVGIMLTVIMIPTNMVTYYRSKKRMEAYLSIVNYIARLLSAIDELRNCSNEAVKPLIAEIAADAKKMKEFKRGAVVIGGGNGDLLDLVMDYVRMLFHVDIIQFYRLIRIFRKHRKELNHMYEKVGLIDTSIAVASFRKMVPYYSKPELYNKKKPFMKAEGLYHVMIENPVTNSINETRSALITGSNASGKSTFIKTLAINAILSQTIYTSLTSHYEASYFCIASSMALRDDILSKESYYIVEIKSLKRIIDRLNPEVPMLCFVDEILRGTNTLERIAASSEILCSLAKSNALCFAATHDIELTHILEDYYSNYHFQEQIVDNNILFDYKLYEGRAVSKNAIKLLSIMGYSNDIIKKATNAANHFLNSGEWDKIER